MMQDWARIQSAIEIIDRVIDGQGPVDRLLREFGRANRYAGSKDRRAIADLVYSALKDGHGLLAASGLPVSGRSLALADCIRRGNDPAALFAGLKHGPAGLSYEEISKINGISDDPDVLDWLPDWSVAGFQARFGDDVEGAVRALHGRAPVDIRVNSLKAVPQNVSAMIAEAAGEAPQAIDGLPNGLRLPQAGPSLSAMSAYNDGLFEIQDAASQLAAGWADVQPGQLVIDLCAGAGGKSLAMAEQMENQGQILAFDIDPGRMTPLKRRAGRTGATIIECLSDSSELAAYSGGADRVVLDVPCTGSGTWRRHPELKWHWSTEKLADVVKVQAELLDQGANLVKPGGNLVYFTCSLLPEENEQQIEAFLARNHGFALRGVDPGCYQNDLAKLAGTVQLAPHISDTDGFFTALMERTG